MRGRLLAAAGAAALLGGQAQADTLREALVRVYETSPTLAAQRAQLRQLDEGVAVARSQGRPQVSGITSLNQDAFVTGPQRTGRSLTVGADVSFPLYTAGRVGNSIRAADERVLAGRADLRAVEGDTFTEAVSAYMDVIRDSSIVELNRNQVEVLETNLQASRDRFEVGDLTRTDVAQSEARLALARSNLTSVEGQLVASQENYLRVIGDAPDNLQPPEPLPPLPGTAEQAVDVAVGNSPDLISISRQIRAAGLDIDITRAGRLPSVSALGSLTHVNALGSGGGGGNGLGGSVSSGGVGLRATVPLYQGGLVGAQVRQAQAFQNQLLEQAVAVERGVVASARSAFAFYQAAREAIESNEIAVSANALALEGTRAEQSVGTRNILDVLNAEQELLNSQVALVSARRDAYVAGFQLLNAMGRAEADDLNLDGGALYDPVANYDRVSRRASDWADDPTPVATSTRTVMGPSPIAPAAQTGPVTDVQP